MGHEKYLQLVLSQHCCGSVVRTVEILDMSTLTWRQGLELPEYVTGTSLILINGRPAIVGR